MQHFSIHFAYPWLLLLLIPAFGLTLLLYFRLNKKYRKTRNRIVSIVLHCIVMTLVISVLAGIDFRFTVSNLENELIVLVDVSDTAEESRTKRDTFLQTVFEESKYDHYKVGVVTFGYTQVYAVPLTYDTDAIYDDYLTARLPDTSATDIAAALRYAKSLFEHPETAKIVLVTDGKETDGTATSVIRAIAAQGTKVDTVYISSDYAEDSVQVTGVQFPDLHINLYKAYNIGVTVQSKHATQSTTVEFYDNGERVEVRTLALAGGTQTLSFKNTFRSVGLHEITVKVAENGDSVEQNNTFCSYVYLEEFKNVLVIEQVQGQSDRLIALLREEGYTVDPCNLRGNGVIPKTVDELRVYDQVILNNISNTDLQTAGLDEILYSYVYTYGGGLFTTGGGEDGKAHAYNHDDMVGTRYQEMLPVEAINYTPPVGVMVIIDISGSMDEVKLDQAKQGAIACLDALNNRDYMGVMTLDMDYGKVLDPTQCTKESLIKEAILSIGRGTETYYSTAIERAGQALRDLKQVDKRHIVLVSDGLPATDDTDRYLQVTDELYKTDGITLSFVGIGFSETALEAMRTLVQTGHGRLHNVEGDKLEDLIPEMREDLNAKEIKEVNPKPFNPIVDPTADKDSVLLDGVNYGKDGALSVKLGGFYGVKERETATVLLMGEYEVPIYAQWDFGNGKVGSFMCDVYGEWSTDFMADPDGRRLLINAIANRMPTENIRPNSLRVEMKEENYSNELSVYTSLEEGEYIVAKLYGTGPAGKYELSLNELGASSEGDVVVTMALGADSRYTRCSFIVKRSGVYRLEFVKYDASGGEKAKLNLYKSFSYSKEYDPVLAQSDPEDLLSELASRSNGSAVSADSPWDVFNGFITELSRTFDPRIVFMAVAMALFLLDIAVRKFKFKWPHELYREYRQRRGEKQ